MLSAVIERMLKAMRAARPVTVRQFFHIASQHMRWELNDVARRLDQGASATELREEFVAPPADSDSTIGPNALRMLRAIEGLPEEQREVFDFIRIHGMSQPEAAELLGISVRNRSAAFEQQHHAPHRRAGRSLPAELNRGGPDAPPPQ